MQMGGNQYGRNMESRHPVDRVPQIVKTAGCPRGGMNRPIRDAGPEDA